ncbi:hypothetical protein BRARA_A03893 [Brassica rapa]|uniref:Hexosyltransferase n=1 Tax=Brassica campestris TaxID=3711 RepID=A0A398B093_BRACM|nr:hypothetical protein BRARA_A03893 [Brassica rapa]
MASTMKPCPITNLEEEAEDGGAAVERSIFTQDDESTSVFVCDSPLFHDRDIDCDPYFPFAGHPISDSGSDSELDPYTCPIDFFDRETSEGVYLGSGGLTGDDFNVWGFYEPKEEEEEREIVLGSRCESGSGSDQQPGLRVTGLDSDSDYEDDVFNFTSGESENVANESGRVEVVTGLPPVWDYDLGDENEEWEEVRNAINWTVRAFSSSEDEEELSSQSRDDHEEEEEEEDHELDWQVLITINNVVNYIEQAEGITIDPGDIDPSYYMYLASLSDGDAADDAILGQMFDNEVGIRGNPPAAKRIVDDLPVVELTVEQGDVVCAVCKDEMVLEEEVKRLPCRHLYHGECITPWLGIRNTCPVCRFELPTDDAEYEAENATKDAHSLKFKNPKYLSMLNHLRFYLPEMYLKLNKILFLDDDVVVQKDVTGLWKINLDGKVNGAVETCFGSFHRYGQYLNFTHPLIIESFNPNVCAWAFGMNIFDLNAWRREKCTDQYHYWQNLNEDRTLWELGTLPPGLMTFYSKTKSLDKSWHVLGLGYNPGVSMDEIKKAAVIHYNGNMKPWLDIAMNQYKSLWTKYVDNEMEFVQMCNFGL